MNRRRFLTLFAKGVATVTLAIHIDPQRVANLFGGETATQLLTKEWNRINRGKKSRELTKTIYLGRQLYEKFEGELTVLQRWTTEEDARAGVPSLANKTCRCLIEGEGWGYRFEN